MGGVPSWRNWLYAPTRGVGKVWVRIPGRASDPYVITVIRDFTERTEAFGYMTRARTGGHGHLLDRG